MGCARTRAEAAVDDDRPPAAAPAARAWHAESDDRGITQDADAERNVRGDDLTTLTRCRDWIPWKTVTAIRPESAVPRDIFAEFCLFFVYLTTPL